MNTLNQPKGLNERGLAAKHAHGLISMSQFDRENEKRTRERESNTAREVSVGNEQCDTQGDGQLESH